MPTVLGNHTADELRWLIKSRDYFFGVLRREFNASFNGWTAKDPGAVAKFGADLLAFELRYAKARQPAVDALAAYDSPQGGGINADDHWDAILKAFQQTYPTPTRSPGDFSDLVERMRAAGYPVSFPNIPSDTSVDQSMAVYKTADDAWRAVGKTVDRVTSWGGGFAVGALVAVAALIWIGGRR